MNNPLDGIDSTAKPLSEQIALQLRGMIFDQHRFQPGDRLPDERSLAIEMGVSRTSLREAIKIVIHSPEMINSITKELYPAIAAHFDTSSSKVERAIRHSIEVAWARGKIENLNAIFGYNIYGKNDKPTNGEFIALIADRLMLEQTA